MNILCSGTSTRMTWTYRTYPNLILSPPTLTNNNKRAGHKSYLVLHWHILWFYGCNLLDGTRCRNVSRIDPAIFAATFPCSESLWWRHKMSKSSPRNFCFKNRIWLGSENQNLWNLQSLLVLKKGCSFERRNVNNERA